jgi:ribosomal protein S18 acetylase RimI-like enzyme
VRQQDLASLAEVLASSFHAQEGWMRWVYPLLRAGIYEDLKSRFHSRSAHYACLVAVKPTLKGQAVAELASRATPAAVLLTNRGDALVGTVELSLKTPLQPWNPKYLYLSNLAVTTDYRRQGIAQRLLHTCERIARDWGFTDLYLHVLENNHQARRLYWKAGYRVHRIEVNPFTLLLGQPRQLFLHKRLN